MNTFTKSFLVVAALSVAACSNPDRFGAGSGTGAGTGAYGAGAGSISDPTSVAYFNQTVGDRVLFAVDQSTLSDVATVTLDGQAAWLMANGEYSATIEGQAGPQLARAVTQCLAG